MALVVAGISHKTASAELRGKLSISQERLFSVLQGLVANEQISEAVVLSTCNRTEVYATALTAFDGMRILLDTLLTQPGVQAGDELKLRAALYVKQGPAAVEHLFRVTASLESLVLGEAQILGQVRRAFADAQEAKATSDVLNRLFRSALEVGKRVRSETVIGQRSVSVPSAAVSLARRELGSLEGVHALVVGAGETGLIALGYLKEQGVASVVVANRTLEHAVQAAQQTGGRPAGLEQLAKELAMADVVVACAGGRECLVSSQDLKMALSTRDGRPLVVVDVSMPRTVEVCEEKPESLRCFNLDDIAQYIEENEEMRRAESSQAEKIVDEAAESFLAWLQEREVIPTVKQIYDKARVVCDGEVQRALKRFAALADDKVSDEQRVVLEAMANAVAKKLLHGPTARLRKQASDPDAYRYTEAARYLFGLDAYPEGFSCRCDEGRRCKLDAGSHCARHDGGVCTRVANPAPFSPTGKQKDILSASRGPVEQREKLCAR